MKTLISQLENPLVVQDIQDLKDKILDFALGKIRDDEFRGMRTARGVYSQRQFGVQMVRIKVPMGKLNFRQLLCIADVADKYASKYLHLTTRQAIQIYGASLGKTPELWAALEQEDITLRGSGGNTVRNVTASPTAGIDSSELFDVTPYAYAVYKYFLRNPVAQEMGRKVKISFSSSEDDTAFSFIHDLGFIPKIKLVNGARQRGFKVLVGGGLGAQPALAPVAKEFLPEAELISFIESTLRVFGRYGERNNRHKARLKFLVNQLGVEEMLRLIEKEQVAVNPEAYLVDFTSEPLSLPRPDAIQYGASTIHSPKYQHWLATNVIAQKQLGFYGIAVKINGGDMTSELARKFVSAIQGLVADDIRITQTQGFVLRYANKEALPVLFSNLDQLGLAEPGCDSVADITTCRGTNTCNLGIANSLGLAGVLEQLIYEKYERLIYNRDIKIKISGCMNSCGHHGLAQIGFHGSSIKANNKVVPAVQVLLGGGVMGDGRGRIADKVIKVPSKRAPQVLTSILDDYTAYAFGGENFQQYYIRNGKDYFYQMLKPMTDTSLLTDDDYVDWGNDEPFKTAIGTGECAGVIIDLTASLFNEANEKLKKAKAALVSGEYADAIYYAYSTMIIAAKAALLKKEVNCGTQLGIIDEFDKYFAGIIDDPDFSSFHDLVLQINQLEPEVTFGQSYCNQAGSFLQKLMAEEK
ncbi:HEPN domain-containing protein [Chitinophagaceae bacterium LB-8]|uniref:HEPN domain-containing protein n=1 Tax=Paraflavisolibacter caeni TaxID=2982496 RepID=A0A9X2XZD3_9BACT|nr:HEPN domain-containing protein [Paraflavisolibacter caeni]MCU7551716.1 HEPN domain-containing protein [Paraflavisolibacter caeni]